MPRKNPAPGQFIDALRERAPAAGLSNGDIEDLIEEINAYVDAATPAEQAFGISRLADVANRALNVPGFLTPEEVKGRIALVRALLSAVSMIGSDLRRKVE